MLYKYYIQNIINKRGRFGIPKGIYKERHHIAPKCLGGIDDEINLIDLYPHEHFNAHKLLAKEHYDNEKLVRGFWLMYHTVENAELTANEYAKLKKEYSKIQSIKMKEQVKNGLLNQKRNKGKHFYNNGIKNVMMFECPDGFVKGRLLSEKGKEALNKLHKNMKGKTPWNKGMMGGIRNDKRAFTNV